MLQWSVMEFERKRPFGTCPFSKGTVGVKIKFFKATKILQRPCSWEKVGVKINFSKYDPYFELTKTIQFTCKLYASYKPSYYILLINLIHFVEKICKIYEPIT